MVAVALLLLFFVGRDWHWPVVMELNDVRRGAVAGAADAGCSSF